MAKAVEVLHQLSRFARSALAGRLLLTILIITFSPFVLVPCLVDAKPSVKQTFVMAHYMPWFESPPASKRYGWHWTMDHFDPQRAGQTPHAASYYTPLIGFYDSGDPFVLEYEALLIKIAGIDGAIIDWYGTDNYFDYGFIDHNTAKFIDLLTKFGLRFAIMYEDRTVPKLIAGHVFEPQNAVEHGHEILRWLSKGWFSRPNYLRLNGRPLLLVFGPQYYKGADFTSVFENVEPKPYLFTMQNPVGPAVGGFAWPLPKGGTASGALELNEFYDRARKWQAKIPVAYPRFHDIYELAGVHHSLGEIEDLSGKTYRSTLSKALASGAPVVQLATWNDWGEGTQIEPSVQFGYRDLEITQATCREMERRKSPSERDNQRDFSSFSAADLRLPKRIYDLRHRYRTDMNAQQQLDRASQAIAAGETRKAKEMLNRLER